MPTIVEGLAVLGVILSLPYLYHIADFLWLYFLRPTTIHHYLHGAAPFALVTGATDGIGKATAAELYDLGFNLILHGRNEKKMQKVIEELRARGKRDADIRYVLADATKAGHDFDKLIEPFKDLNITLVIHNVGGSNGVQPERLDERPEEYIHNLVHWNALFPLLLTRVLLPQLRRSAKHGPVIVQFVGSLAGDISPPRLPIYAASKRFLEALTRGLDNDELFFDGPTGVRFTYLAVGPVNSASMHQKPSLNTPTSERFAKAIIARTGCGRRRVAPYAMHAISKVVVEALGQRTVDYYTAEEMKVLIKHYAKSE
ncbi:NAD-P-binding protein [Trametes coccinea BRFM310]|uniref:NAD-P-binding protein n=1 Tax=Trametes coccinea (strain BRFM310) TaxID=1353009 RepID=A0A1Y2IDI1_TRAC3|nr:NAD-P-binding protein [Trametes coccinea BRFM310]